MRVGSLLVVPASPPPLKGTWGICGSDNIALSDFQCGGKCSYFLNLIQVYIQR